MHILPNDLLAQYWNAPAIGANLIIFAHLLGALLLGLLVGYERSYHGRAAGMRTYGIVCMTSAALTVFAGFPGYWFGMHSTVAIAVDPTRVVQGIVTGIGFLGAGVIMRDGMTISGLTTAASIWASSAIGILVGLGFYAAAILFSLLSAALMMWGGKLEGRLPAQPAVAITLRFAAGFVHPEENTLRKIARERGYVIANGSFLVRYDARQLEWQFVAVAINGQHSTSLTRMADELAQLDGVERFQMSHARN
ncbi:MAG TPA: MgtC/SapB family protein [Spongiibacteraceae bacterium]|nr:MgtC/SapB family protein [Spongiibacteraceae bacterium]